MVGIEFSKFGITFKPLDHDNLEMVRIWRNSDDVRVFMQFQEIITSEQQVNWFSNLDKTKNYYFVAYKDGKPFGLYNIKDVDFEKMTGESGVFLKNKESWEGDAGMRGSLALINFAFENLKLEILICHVLKTNLKVLTFNKYLGFNISKNTPESISYELSLNRLDFYNKKKIIKLFKYLATN